MALVVSAPHSRSNAGRQREGPRHEARWLPIICQASIYRSYYHYSISTAANQYYWLCAM